jgi:predicted nicotinamide N-methyase
VSGIDAATTPIYPPEARAFVLAHTTVLTVPACPEIRLHQVHALTTLWEAGQARLGALGIGLPFWAVPWAGGCGLSRHLLDRPQHVAGRRVLDLGTGSGLCAIAAARGGASTVTACDPDPVALAAVSLNARLNGAQVRPHAGDPLTSAPPAVDLILAADLWYEQPLAGRVTTWLRAAALAGIEVIAADPNRAYAPRAGTRTLATLAVPTCTEIERDSRTTVRVFRITGDAGGGGPLG